MRHSSRMQDAKKVGSFLQREDLLQNLWARTLNYRVVRRPCSESLQREGSLREFGGKASQLQNDEEAFI